MTCSSSRPKVLMDWESSSQSRLVSLVLRELAAEEVRDMVESSLY